MNDLEAILFDLIANLGFETAEKLYVPTPLAQGNSVAGHRLEMAWRKDNVAVFARSIPGRAPHEYEVVIIRIAPAAVSPSGTLITKARGIPKLEQMGNARLVDTKARPGDCVGRDGGGQS